MRAWLDIVGVPETGLEALAPGLLELVTAAEVVIGVPRRLAGLERASGRTLVEWSGSLEAMVERIVEARPLPTVLLASGDPNWFGIGATLARHLPAEAFALHPAPSSFQLAAARLHWPLQHLSTLSLHGRPVAALHPHVLPGNRVLALTTAAATAAEVASLLVGRGYGPSRLTLLEHLGGPRERIATTTAAAFGPAGLGDFYVLAIDCVADAGAPLLPAVPGLPDAAFVHDGQLTKREVRAATLARLAPWPGALLWDVGAGCGSVGIEWMRAARDARAIAFERDAGRLAMIAANADALGVPGLVAVPGPAPVSFADQPAPDAVFLGGGVADEPLWAACWAALRPGGRIVANAVTLAGESALYARHAAHGGELVRIAISVLDAVGTQRVLRPRMAVTQWLGIKP